MVTNSLALETSSEIAWNEHSSLFWRSFSDEEKTFYDIDFRCTVYQEMDRDICYKTFSTVISIFAKLKPWRVIAATPLPQSKAA